MRKSDNKEQRENIIKAAKVLFARYGFKKTTMNDIAKTSKKAKSSLYYYFVSKEDVIKAVIENEASELKSKLEIAMKKAHSPQEKLKAYMITRMLAMRELSNLYIAFKDEYVEMYDFIEKIRKNYDRYEIETFKKIMIDGLKSGIFSVKDLDLTAYAIAIATKGIEYKFATEKNSETLEKDINALMDILFNGIAKK